VRALLRVLAPLLGIALAAVGVLVVIEVVAAWVLPGSETGLLVPWPAWGAALAAVSWNEAPVPGIAIGVAVAGLVLVVVGLAARRVDVHLDGPTPDMTVTTSPRVLARLVGTRVRASDDVASASVTASSRRVAVSVRAWADASPELRDTVATRVGALLDDLPLRRRPRLAVSVQEREGLQ
jgi:Family of unknown function (DUF6286)